MLIRKLLILLTMSLVSATAFAQKGTSSLGPDIGVKIPHDLSFMATSGQIESFDSLKGENGVAIFFTRSFTWCPYCQKQAREVNERAAEFKSRGLIPVFVSYDTPEIQKNFYDKWEFTIPILSDTGLESITAFDVLNEDTSKSSPIYGYPHPIVFIVSPDGIIRSKLYIESETIVNGSSYKERPEIDAILAAIVEMNEAD